MFLITLTVGCIVVAAISLSPLYRSRLRTRSPALGAGLVLGAVGVAGACLAVPSGLPRFGNELFLCAFLLLLVGSLLVIGDDPDDDHGEDGDDEPPWWPEFEASFRRYERRRRRPLPTR